MEIPSFCMPAKVYLVLSLLGMIYTLFSGSIGIVILHLLFIVLWTWFLNWLCDNGYSSISWLLVLFPYFIFMLVFLLMFFLTLMSLPNLTINPTTNVGTIRPTAYNTPRHWMFPTKRIICITLGKFTHIEWWVNFLHLFTMLSKFWNAQSE